MDNIELDPKEELEQIEHRRKELKHKILTDKEIRLKKEAEMRMIRDEKIENIQKKIGKIQNVIYSYNRSGKVAKDKTDIFAKILSIMQEDIVVGSDIDESIKYYD